MPAKLDPDAAAVYKAFQDAGRPAYETLTAAEARAYYSAARLVSNPDPADMASVRSIAIPGPAGDIPARLYTPNKLRQDEGLAPALVFFHGGGWVIGDLDTHDVVCRGIAHDGELLVISVDYRLAPEHKFPLPSTTQSPRRAGSPTMPGSSASIPSSSASAATAPAAMSPRWSRCTPAITVDRCSPARC